MSNPAIYAVIGDPIGHSLSPIMHNGWIADAGLNAVYIALRVTDPNVIAQAPAWGFKGLNVTIPHKETAAQLADGRDETTKALGVANTLRIEDDHTINAFNTDAPGFLFGLDHAAPGWRAGVKQALVLGAGGAARAIAHALRGQGCAVTIANRTRARAEAVAAKIDAAQTLDWADLPAGFQTADLIVNGTSLGLYGGESFDWPLDRCANHAILADAVYRPLRTPFLAAGQARNLRTVDGLGMLIGQGALAFELWFGIQPDVARARKRLLAALGEGGE